VVETNLIIYEGNVPNRWRFTICSCRHAANISLFAGHLSLVSKRTSTSSVNSSPKPTKMAKFKTNCECLLLTKIWSRMVQHTLSTHSSLRVRQKNYSNISKRHYIPDDQFREQFPILSNNESSKTTAIYSKAMECKHGLYTVYCVSVFGLLAFEGAYTYHVV